MTKTLAISTLVIFGSLLFSCSNQEARLKSIEKEFSIDLPNGYEVIQDEDISHNGFESDYTQILTLKFDKDGLNDLIEQIENSPYFNELENYVGKAKVFPNDSTDVEHQEILDSLGSSSRSGTWIKDGFNYKYIDFFKWSDFCDGYIDISNRTLKYTHNHL